MAIRFTPSGQLDIATDPLSLPQQSDGKNTVSGAMTRCLNLRLDRPGKAETRKGTYREPVALDTPVWLLSWMDGHRYEFAGDKIYRDGVQIASGKTQAQWYAAAYYPYSSITQSLYCANGTDLLRISESTAYTWGIAAPTTAPVLSGNVPVVYSFAWEADQERWIEYTDTVMASHQYEWEEEFANITSFYNQFLRDQEGYYTQWYDRTKWSSDDYPYVPSYSWEREQYLSYLASLGKISDYYTMRKLTETEDETDYLFSWEETQIQGGVSYYDTPYDYVFCWWNEIGGEADQDFGVKYTYCRKNGDLLECESNPSPASSIMPVLGACYVTWEIPTDPQITHVRIYRTMAGGADYYYAEEFAVAAGAGVVAKADEELGSGPPTDHDPPPAGATILIGPTNDGYLMAIVGNLLYYSKSKQPEYWPTDYYLDICSPDETVMAAQYFYSLLYLATDRDIYQITGTSPSSYFPLPLNTGAGTMARRCFYGSRATGLVRLWTDGVYQYTGGRDVTVSELFSPIFDAATKYSTPGLYAASKSSCWLVQYGDKLYFGYPSESGYPDNVIVFDTTAKRPMHYQFPVKLSGVWIDPDNTRLLAADEDGYIWWLEQDDLTADNGASIAWDCQTKDFGSLRKYFPRYARYDVELLNGASAKAYVQLDDVSKQAHAISTRNTKQRHIETCTGDRLSIRLTGSGPVTIHSMEIQ